MKKLVRRILLLACAVLFVSTLVSMASAKTVASGECGENLSWQLNDQGVLRISGTGPMDDYDEYSSDPIISPWQEMAVEHLIKAVVIENGVTSIGTEAFLNCDELESVSIPGSLTSIGYRAFFSCDKINSIHIPAAVKTIGFDAFAYNGLQKIAVDTSNKYFAGDSSGVLYNKSMTKLVQAPGKLRGSYYIPSGVTCIETYAFSGCSGLNSVYFQGDAPEFVETVWLGAEGEDDEVFYSTFIGVTATAYYPAGNTTWTTDKLLNYGGNITWVATKYEPSIIASGSCGDRLNWTLDTEGLLTISGEGEMDNYWFEDIDYSYLLDRPWDPYKESIHTIMIENGVTSIGSGAFEGYREISSINIPASVIEIGTSAFLCFGQLSSINVDQSSQHFITDTSGVLYSKNKTNLIQAPEELSGTYRIPASVTKIARFAFYNCRGLHEVYFSGNAPYFEYGLLEIDAGAVEAVYGKNYDAFQGTKLTAYYPADNSTWTKDKLQDYGGDITWVPYGDTQIDTPTVKISNVASTGKIKLSWNKVDGAAKYQIVRSLDNKNWEHLAYSTGTSATNTKTDAGKTYYYKIRAIDANGNKSAYSNIVSRMCDLPQPAAKIKLNTNGKPLIYWDAVDGAVAYKVYIYDVNGKLQKTTTLTNVKLTHSSAAVGSTYKYRVVAIHSNSAANSAYSAYVSKTCSLPQPKVTATNVASTGKIKLSWNKIEGATKYEIYRATSKNGTYSKLTTTTNTTATNTKIDAGKTYYYKVRAIHSNTAANSEFSAVVSRTCDLPQPKAQIKLNTKGKPLIYWAAVEGAVEYKVYIYDANGKLLNTATLTNVKITHTSAVPGTTYKYRVEAIHSNSAANSAKSNLVSIKSK